ncbi:MAG TPA: hypothetical protein PK011_15050 [Marinagarivorans sp.]|nr:hypothetical protein [Marinagarivorans sp.]HNG60536.1 hypothetical protein [Cellvibrionaceae bacterium]
MKLAAIFILARAHHGLCALLQLTEGCHLQKWRLNQDRLNDWIFGKIFMTTLNEYWIPADTELNYTAKILLSLPRQPKALEEIKPLMEAKLLMLMEQAEREEAGAVREALELDDSSNSLTYGMEDLAAIAWTLVYEDTALNMLLPMLELEPSQTEPVEPELQQLVEKQTFFQVMEAVSTLANL